MNLLEFEEIRQYVKLLDVGNFSTHYNFHYRCHFLWSLMRANKAEYTVVNIEKRKMIANLEKQNMKGATAFPLLDWFDELHAKKKGLCN